MSGLENYFVLKVQGVTDRLIYSLNEEKAEDRNIKHSRPKYEHCKKCNMHLHIMYVWILLETANYFMIVLEIKVILGTSDRPQRPFIENYRNRKFGKNFRKYRTKSEKNQDYK